MKITEQDIIEYCEVNADCELTGLYEVIGAKALCNLISTYSGCAIYIPLATEILRNKRDHFIRRDYQKGFTIPQLAKLYNLTARTIYSVIKTKR